MRVRVQIGGRRIGERKSINKGLGVRRDVVLDALRKGAKMISMAWRQMLIKEN